MKSVTTNLSSMGMRPISVIREGNGDSEGDNSASSNVDTANHGGIAFSDRLVR